MGWFKKKEKKENKKEISSLPELPKLPELPMDETEEFEPIHQLPSFPTNSLGDKFSQNTIKEAVTGKKEGEEVFDADEFVPEKKIQRMHKPLKETPEEFKRIKRASKEAEPIFIRIDKFEEGLEVFEKTKKQISEIEKMLRDIKRIREDEEKELEIWENEIQTAKEQIEKVDKDIFSKIE